MTVGLQPAARGRLADRDDRARHAGSASSTASRRWTPTSCSRRSPRRRSPTSSTPTTARVLKARKSLLPAAAAYDGIHARPPAARRRPALTAPPERTSSWTCSSPARACSSPAAPAASAARSSRRSPTRGRPWSSAPATPPRSRRPRRPWPAAAPECAASGSTSATARRSTAWVADAAGRLGGIDAVVANVSALAVPDTEENWRLSFEVDLMHTVRLAPGRPAAPGGRRPRVDRRDLQRLRARGRLRRRALRDDEDGDPRLRQGAGVPAGRPRRARQRRLARQHLLRRRLLAAGRAGHAGAVRLAARAQPDRPDGQRPRRWPGPWCS